MQEGSLQRLCLLSILLCAVTPHRRKLFKPSCIQWSFIVTQSKTLVRLLAFKPVGTSPSTTSGTACVRRNASECCLTHCLAFNHDADSSWSY